jgi:putative hydrolase of the HAD superfamily
MTRSVNAVIFDLGGTLIHYDTPAADMRALGVAGLDSLYTALAARGATLPPRDRFIEEGYAFILADVARDQAARTCRSIEVPLRAHLVEHGLTVADADWPALRDAYYAPMDRLITVRGDTRETLAALRQAGLRLALLSNTLWAADVHDRHLREHGLLDYIPVRLYSCDYGRYKPDPAIFRAVCDLLGVAPGHAVYVGDRVREDVLGAQAAGLRAVLIRVPYREELLTTARPDAVISELGELPAALEALG